LWADHAISDKALVASPSNFIARYDYNQIMDVLSLDDPRLTLPSACVDRE
jgi:hypothetical protein